MLHTQHGWRWNSFLAWLALLYGTLISNLAFLGATNFLVQALVYNSVYIAIMHCDGIIIYTYLFPLPSCGPLTMNLLIQREATIKAATLKLGRVP